MEQEIQDKLEEIYKNLYIEVTFKEFRKYNISIAIEYQENISGFDIEFVYDANLTFDANIDSIKSIIEYNILKLFKKEEF